MNETTQPGPLEVRLSDQLGLVDERAKFVAWLSAYAGGGEHWRGNVLMGEHDAALAAWLHQQEKINRLIEERARFPGRPDWIGEMIGSHYRNLKARADSMEDAWRRAQAIVDSLAVKAVRLNCVLGAYQPARSARLLW
jgi:hypothetical protein